MSIEDEYSAQVIELAKFLHEAYLRSVKILSPDSYNPNAVKPWDELTDQQKSIDIYIAKCVLGYFYDDYEIPDIEDPEEP